MEREVTEPRADVVEDSDAALRAALAERYQEERERTSNDDDADEEDEDAFMFTHDPTAEITGIEADIEDVEGSLLELKEKVEDVKKVRFTLDNGDKTKWYEWHPDNPEHQLTQLVDHYTNGNIQNLVGEDVFISYIHDSPHIAYPAPYTHRSSHLAYPVYRKLAELNNPEEGDYYSVNVVKSHDSDEAVSPDIYLGQALGERGSLVLGGLLSPLPLIATVVAFFLGGMVAAAVAYLGLIVLALGVSTQMRNTGRFSAGFVFGPVIGAAKAVKRIVGVVRSLNRVDPME